MHDNDTDTKTYEIEESIYFRGGTILNVYSGELVKGNVITKGERFYYVGPSSPPLTNRTRTIDVSGKFLVPGYIDPHFHPWFIFNPITFGKEACIRGTTTLFCDSLLFYMLMGPNGFKRFIESFSDAPIKYYWFLRSDPQTPMADENELFSAENLKRLLKNPMIQSLGEITRWPDVINGNKKILELIEFSKNLKKRIDGHTAGAKYDHLNILSRRGIESCHEAINEGEALERLRLGMYVILRESSLRQDLRDLLKIVTKNRVFTDRLMLSSDCSSPSFYQKFGITDHIIKIAIDAGIDPILVYRMVTLNPAVYFGMDHQIGGIAPGRFADMVILTHLEEPKPEMVISKGRIIAQNERFIDTFPDFKWNKFIPQKSLIKDKWNVTQELFDIKVSKRKIKFPVISLITTVITRLEWEEFIVKDGILSLPQNNNYSFIHLLSRDGRWITSGIIKGFGNVEGFASSFNTASQILVIGKNRNSMAKAVNRIIEIRGGIVTVEGERIVYELPLPICGIMSDKSIDELSEKERELKNFLKNKGYTYHDPFYTLVFLPNDFLPEVRINFNGIVNIKTKGVLWHRRDLK